MQARSLSITDGIVSYDGLGGRLTLDTEHGALPTVDGETVDLGPAMTFNSPWLRSVWGSGDVTVGQGADALVVKVP